MGSEDVTTAHAFQVCSDIHFEEMGDAHKISFDHILKPSAPYLILAGDIGDPATCVFADFLAFCSERFERIFMVAGNHEYYGTRSMDATDALLSAVCSRFSNVTLMNQASHEIAPDVILLGLTLWTYVPRFVWNEALSKVNDYKYIPGCTPQELNLLHARHADWLRRQLALASQRGQRVIVVTHHPPSMSGTSLPRFSNDPVKYCYRNRLDSLVSSPCNVAWVCGHTHFSFSQRRGSSGGTLLMSNQYCSRMYNPQATFLVHKSNMKPTDNESEEAQCTDHHNGKQV